MTQNKNRGQSLLDCPLFQSIYYVKLQTICSPLRMIVKGMNISDNFDLS